MDTSVCSRRQAPHDLPDLPDAEAVDLERRGDRSLNHPSVEGIGLGFDLLQ